MKDRLIQLLEFFIENSDGNIEKLAKNLKVSEDVLRALVQPLILLGVLTLEDEQTLKRAHGSKSENTKHFLVALLLAAESSKPAVPDFETTESTAAWVKIVRLIDENRGGEPGRSMVLAQARVFGKFEGEWYLLVRIDAGRRKLKLPGEGIEREPSVDAAYDIKQAQQKLLDRFQEDFFGKEPLAFFTLGFEHSLYEPTFIEPSDTVGLRTAYTISVYSVESFTGLCFPYPEGTTLRWISIADLRRVFATMPKSFFPDRPFAQAMLSSEPPTATAFYRMERHDIAHQVTLEALERLSG
jgi:hypothetical protein